MLSDRFGKFIALTALLLTAMTAANAQSVDGTPTFSNSDAGLYIWRSNGNVWHLRLVGGNTGGRNFDGNFQSNRAINDVNRIILEGVDDVTKSAWDTVTVDLNAPAWDVDGVSFKTGDAATLCLKRVRGIQQVFLGGNAAPASFPVSLAGSNACGGGGGGGGGGGSVSDSGLFVSQKSNGAWQARLVSKSKPVEFSGTFEATQNITSLNRVDLENSDTAWQPDAKTVQTSLETWPVGTDEINISTPAGAGMCVRSNTGAETTIYLGSSPSNALAATTPVDLTNSGACDGAGGAGGGGGGGGGGNGWLNGRKYNPGHYVALMRGNDSHNTMSSTPSAGAVGFMKRYTWRELEPSQGNYNFAEITADLNYLAGQGKRLVVMIEDKTFVNENPIPGYLSHLAHRNRSNGFTGERWSPQYVTRMKALLTAIGNRFNTVANFEGVSTMESAPSLDNSILSNTAYTAAKYRDALIEVLRHGAQAMPQSRMIWYFNFLPKNQSYLSDVIRAVKSYGVIPGGPDIEPDDEAIMNMVYPIYREFRGTLPMHGQVEPRNYHAPHASPSATVHWTPAELFRYGRDNLQVSYIFWVRYPKAQFWNSYDYFDAAPVIANNPNF